VTAWKGEVMVLGGMSSDGKPSKDVDLLNIDSMEWRKGPPLPMTGFGVAACAHRDTVLVGLMDGSLFRLTEDGTAWVQAGATLFGRYFQRMVPLRNDRIAVLGGASKQGHLCSMEILSEHAAAEPHQPIVMEMESDGQALNRQGMTLTHGRLALFGGNVSNGQHDFEPEHFANERLVLDLARLSIHREKDLPIRRQSMVATALSGRDSKRHLLLGGFGHDGVGARSFADAFLYDAQKETLEAIDLKLPAALTQFGMVQHKGELWIFGGVDYDSQRPRAEAFRHQDAILRATIGDVAEGLELIPVRTKLPISRRAFGSAAIESDFYIVGGMTDGFTPVDSFLKFNLDTESIEELPTPAPRISPELVAHEGRLFMVGGSSKAPGERSFAPCKSIEVFDPATNSWSTLLQEIPFEPSHIRMFSFRRSLLLVSTRKPGILRLAFLRTAR
jgi:hypothetical protein